MTVSHGSAGQRLLPFAQLHRRDTGRLVLSAKSDRLNDFGSPPIACKNILWASPGCKPSFSNDVTFGHRSSTKSLFFDFRKLCRVELALTI